MRLTQKIASTVPVRIRERGTDLQRDGAVYIYRGNALEVHASVRGTRLYAVSLTRDDQQLKVVCGCPYFSENSSICKHIWATLISSDAAGYLAEEDMQDDQTGSVPKTPLSDEELSQAMDSFLEQSRSLIKKELWLSQLRSIQTAQERAPEKPWPASREILYLIDVRGTAVSGELTLNIVHREPRRDGTWSKHKSVSLSPKLIGQLGDAADRQILSMTLGTSDPWANSYGYYGYGRDRSVSGSGLTVPASIVGTIVPLICSTGRGRLVEGDADATISMDPGGPWELWLDVTPDPSEPIYWVDATVKRDGQTRPIQEPAFLLTGGFVFWRNGTVAALNDFGSFAWISTIRKQGLIAVPSTDIDSFLERLVELPQLPRLDVPESLQYAEVQGVPQPRLQIAPRFMSAWRGRQGLEAKLTFRYGDQTVAESNTARGILIKNPRHLVLRDRAAEHAAMDTLRGLGLKKDAQGELQITSANMPRIVRALSAMGWTVEAEGSLYRTAGASQVRLSSGIDWFELEGSIAFGDQVAHLPQLLAAARRGEDFVRLGDGTIGLLPEDWLERYAPVANLGTTAGDTLRFKHSQAGLLDALLAVQPEVDVDEVFLQVRDRLNSFAGVAPVHEPSGFQGELRAYQREGLGWFGFLGEFGLGGCLADDMGLGKTVQVLALLETRRQLRESVAGAFGPSLIVVPKSLVFNWLQEAERFTPKLRILDHTGIRAAPGAHFEEYDVVLTTYGTLRKDAAHFNEITFDYAILDEAQAIKNAATASAKSARLLKADHRLALSGTPIENHLGELWSMFEFLNPGMLGGARAFSSALAGRNPDPAARQALAKALKPFILRRTKEQVAKDLPAKTEQTQFCELPAPQRKQYDELRNHYRKDLLERVERDGLASSKMFVLEALLRLRQAACHPGLIDPARAAESSAKLDLLLPQLEEVVAEGHKAIVFSQFTKMLGILRPKLDEMGIPYEYLDGKTRDRQARVENFQNNPEIPLFLISLKAGGLGLNLTSAEYVFLLDPWWNPAVEAQAIDRAHRIGQTKPVFAYRIIAKDTVEEKVLELQATKRALADAIIGADNSLIRQIGREDLELLLS